MKWAIKTFMGMHVLLYRLTKGRFGGKMGGNTILLLTTIGRKSNQARTTPLMYLQDGNDYIIAASNGGGPNHPGWYYNLRNNPSATVEVGGKKINVTAQQAQATERQRLFDRFAAKMPQFAEYQQKTPREIQMFRLIP